MNNDERNRIRQIGAFATLPFTMAVPPILGWYIGRWLDGYFGVAPYLMITLLVLGIIAAARESYRIIRGFGDKE